MYLNAISALQGTFTLDYTFTEEIQKKKNLGMPAMAQAKGP